MKITKYTSLTRAIILNYNTNLLITIIFLFVFVGSFLLFDYSVREGLSNGILIFILWALAREIDVPHDWAAFIGLPLALSMVYFGVEFSNILLFTLLISSRLFSKTNTVKLMNTDYIIVAVLWTFTVLSGSIFSIGSFNYLFVTILGILFYNLVYKIFKQS